MDRREFLTLAGGAVALTAVPSFALGLSTDERCWTGLKEIDVACGGARPGDLWLHASYQGEMKLSFALNWAHHLVMQQGKKVLFVALEMPGMDVMVRTSFENSAFNMAQGRFEIWSPEDMPTVEGIRAEVISRKPDFLIIENIAFVDGEIKDYTRSLSQVVEATKEMAITMNVPVLALMSVNRKAKEVADDNDGIYTLDAFSYLPKVERYADIITTTYLNDAHRRAHVVRFGNPKNRDGHLFESFVTPVDFDNSARLTEIV